MYKRKIGQKIINGSWLELKDEYGAKCNGASFRQDYTYKIDTPTYIHELDDQEHQKFDQYGTGIITPMYFVPHPQHGNEEKVSGMTITIYKETKKKRKIVAELRVNVVEINVEQPTACNLRFMESESGINYNNEFLALNQPPSQSSFTNSSSSSSSSAVTVKRDILEIKATQVELRIKLITNSNVLDIELFPYLQLTLYQKTTTRSGNNVHISTIKIDGDEGGVYTMENPSVKMKQFLRVGKEHLQKIGSYLLTGEFVVADWTKQYNYIQSYIPSITQMEIRVVPNVPHSISNETYDDEHDLSSNSQEFTLSLIVKDKYNNPWRHDEEDDDDEEEEGESSQTSSQNESTKNWCVQVELVSFVEEGENAKNTKNESTVPKCLYLTMQDQDDTPLFINSAVENTLTIDTNGKINQKVILKGIESMTMDRTIVIARCTLMRRGMSSVSSVPSIRTIDLVLNVQTGHFEESKRKRLQEKKRVKGEIKNCEKFIKTKKTVIENIKSRIIDENPTQILEDYFEDESFDSMNTREKYHTFVYMRTNRDHYPPWSITNVTNNEKLNSHYVASGLGEIFSVDNPDVNQVLTGLLHRSMHLNKVILVQEGYDPSKFSNYQCLIVMNEKPKWVQYQEKSKNKSNQPLIQFSENVKPLNERDQFINGAIGVGTCMGRVVNLINVIGDRKYSFRGTVLEPIFGDTLLFTLQETMLEYLELDGEYIVFFSVFSSRLYTSLTFFFLCFSCVFLVFVYHLL